MTRYSRYHHRLSSALPTDWTLRFDLLFSYWIALWAVAYLARIPPFHQFSPVVALLGAFAALLIFIFKTHGLETLHPSTPPSRRLYTLRFLIINLSIKLLPLGIILLASSSTTSATDQASLSFTAFYFLSYVVYLYVQDVSMSDVYRFEANAFVQAQYTTPAMIFMKSVPLPFVK